MFKATVAESLVFDDKLLITCKKIEDGDVTVGSKLSDGARLYDVVGIPFVRYNSVQAMKENILLELHNENFDKSELVGKVLSSV